MLVPTRVGLLQPRPQARRTRGCRAASAARSGRRAAVAGSSRGGSRRLAPAHPCSELPHRARSRSQASRSARSVHTTTTLTHRCTIGRARGATVTRGRSTAMPHMDRTGHDRAGEPLPAHRRARRVAPVPAGPRLEAEPEQLEPLQHHQARVRVRYIQPGTSSVWSPSRSRSTLLSLQERDHGHAPARAGLHPVAASTG